MAVMAAAMNKYMNIFIDLFICGIGASLFFAQESSEAHKIIAQTAGAIIFALGFVLLCLKFRE